jgi:hypothetical protein
MQVVDFADVMEARPLFFWRLLFQSLLAALPNEAQVGELEMCMAARMLCALPDANRPSIVAGRPAKVHVRLPHHSWVQAEDVIVPDIAMTIRSGQYLSG